MKAMNRLLVTLLVVLCGILFLWGTHNYARFHKQVVKVRRLHFAIDEDDEYMILDKESLVNERRYRLNRKAHHDSCRMETCFDFRRCVRDFKVYVYPMENGERVSPTYAKIIQVIKKSVYYTDNPEAACLFVPSYDTLDRDRLSQDYISSLAMKISTLPHWNEGRNHLIFNLYSGTWPDYKEELNMDTAQAIMAKASVSIDTFRPHFDISLPLFPKSHSQFGGGNLPYSPNIFPVLKYYKLVFKGKRYLSGIGSESRNSLYHIHNDRDIIMLTTCKHGRHWQDIKDRRCDKDNPLYDRYDFKELMVNTSFCLIPRGRRLGSYRFLESLEAGCIPLILSNGWILPFADIIDWQKAALFADERLLTLIPTIIRDFSYKQILQMKQQVLFLWDAYFSSVDKIVHTVLETIHTRINKYMAKQYHMWNTFPGSLHLSSSFSRSLKHYPFYYKITGTIVPLQFTAIIYFTSVKELSSLHRLIRSIAKSPFIAKIVVMWESTNTIPHRSKWPSINVTIAVRRSENKNRNNRMAPNDLVETDAILSLDEDINLNTDEINFAFLVWHKFPHRIVGFPARSHYWDEGFSKWCYTSQWRNEYSMVLTSAAFYHRFYNYYYMHHLPASIRQLVATSDSCEDLAINFLVAHVIRQPPIKVLAQRPYKEKLGNLYGKQSKTRNHFLIFALRKKCFASLADEFGYMPLLRSSVRFDPVLYKDPISNFRKKYRLLEV